MNDAAAIKAEILRLTREYSALVHGANRPAAEPRGAMPGASFVPGETTVPYGGRVFDEDEVEAAVDSHARFLADARARRARRSRANWPRFSASSASLLVNSGSSANLLAAQRADQPQAAR